MRYTFARLHKSGWRITKCQQAAFSKHGRQHQSQSSGMVEVTVGGHGVLQVGWKRSGNRLQVCALTWSLPKRAALKIISDMKVADVFDITK